MKIVLPYARVLLGSWSSHQGAMSKIEWVARVSHRSEEAQHDNSWKRFIQSVVIDHGDWSVVEHVSVTVDALVDRGITHEWVRHRLFSFTQESTRFVNYDKKMEPSFIYPNPAISCAHCLLGNEVRSLSTISANYWHDTSDSNTSGVRCAYDPAWLSTIGMAEHSYKSLLREGWRPQEARSVFPNALASRLITTGNLRNWRHFFIMRTTAEAHPQMRQVTIPLLGQFQTAFPLLFDDIEPLAKQSESMRRNPMSVSGFGNPDYRIAASLEKLTFIEGERRDIENQLLDEIRRIRGILAKTAPSGFGITETAIQPQEKEKTLKASVDLRILDDGKGVLYTLTPINAAKNPVPLPSGVTVSASSSAPGSLSVAPDPGDPNTTPPRPADTTGLVFLGTVPQPPVDADGIVATFSATLADNSVISTDAKPVDVAADDSPVGFSITETAE